MMAGRETRGQCPVMCYDRAGAEYAQTVVAWLENPHAYFKAFGPEARAFQHRNRSERLRTMTLVAPAEELVKLRPLQICLDGVSEKVSAWEQVFAVVSGRLLTAYPKVFSLLQETGELAWLGCPKGAASVADLLAEGLVKPSFASLAEVVWRVQWMFLMCGIRLNEVIVQVDPFTDAEWAERHAAIRARRAADKRFMEGRLAAQQAWAEAHPEEMAAGAVPCRPRGLFI